MYISGGEYYNSAASTWQVDSTIYSVDLSLSSYMKWRTLTQGAGNLLNTTTQTGAIFTSMAYVPDNDQIALHLPTVRRDGPRQLAPVCCCCSSSTHCAA